MLMSFGSISTFVKNSFMKLGLKYNERHIFKVYHLINFDLCISVKLSL